ncbi:two component transcriptional regulator, LytTR family [Thermaerobacter marianensis DSM 12885]|uniref:Stage 0 sporulation protein A homolog n=1 Tax=Thermaerobacter marianensis (strain ATCC 700841 / DSM 12885 / JCM 10246 / 7p75a) TaxID=644966 RepID=E6SJZ6_THEM7|nr:LytTR family DNA-binding domain-containing protein [Thermaerobacter marianensis]ADU52229.1 two component transcriptional regulator, LytTR family [Thermaerobacter marianensis DSM 12885]
MTLPAEHQEAQEERDGTGPQPRGPEGRDGADAGAGRGGTGAPSEPAGHGARRAAVADWEWDAGADPAQGRPVRVLIVDDEYPARAELRFRLSREPGVEITGEAATAREALRLIDALEYDVVFLDIAMPGLSGLELAERLRQRPGAPYVIFTTAYDEYAVKAFETRALDYLLKPYSDERLREALSRVRERLAAAAGSGAGQPFNGGGRNGAGGRHGDGGAGAAGGAAAGGLPAAAAAGSTGVSGVMSGTNPASGGAVPGGPPAPAGASGAGAAETGGSGAGGGGTGTPGAGRSRTRPRWVMGVRDEAAVPIPVEEVVYAEAENDQVFVYTATHRFPTRYTLRELEDLLPPDRFFRCHRGYIVNLRKVREISPFFNGTYNLTVVHAGQPVTIPVARSRVPELKRHFWPETG